MTKKHKIRVLFKSGYAQDIECESFSVTRNGLNELQSIAYSGCKPDIMDLRVSEIAAVFQLS